MSKTKEFKLPANALAWFELFARYNDGMTGTVCVQLVSASCALEVLVLDGDGDALLIDYAFWCADNFEEKCSRIESQIIMETIEGQPLPECDACGDYGC